MNYKYSFFDNKNSLCNKQSCLKCSPYYKKSYSKYSLCYKQRGFIHYDIILALIISSALTSLLVLSMYNLVADSYTTFNGADKVFAESNLIAKKFELDLDQANQIINANKNNLSLMTNDNQIITYTINNNSLLRRMNNDADYPLAHSLTSQKNYFEYFDLAYNKLTSLPLNQPDLNSLRFIKMNLEQSSKTITRQYSSVNLLYKYDN